MRRMDVSQSLATRVMTAKCSLAWCVGCVKTKASSHKMSQSLVLLVSPTAVRELNAQER